MVGWKKSAIGGLTVIIVAGGLVINHVFASGNSPGSNSDPLVSKSYVDQQINQALVQIGVQPAGGSLSLEDRNQLVTDILAQIDTLYGSSLRQGGSVETAKYGPVYATTGQWVIGNEGTEIILRSGQATGFCPGESGLVDATTGEELWNGQNVSANHLILVPRDDGRGVRVVQDAWFMIKGGYSIQD